MRLCALSPLFPLSHLLPSLAPRSFTPRFPISSDSTRVPSSSAPRFNYSHAAPVFLSACVTNTTQTPLVRVHEQLSLAGQRAVLTSLSGFRWVLSTAQQPSRVSCCPRHLPAASPHPHPLPFLTGSPHSPSQASLISPCSSPGPPCSLYSGFRSYSLLHKEFVPVLLSIHSCCSKSPSAVSYY